MSQDEIRMKDRKNKPWGRFKNTGYEYDYNRFKEAKNELRALTRNLRMEFENSIAEDVKLAPKKFWSYVRSMTKTQSKIPP